MALKYAKDQDAIRVYGHDNDTVWLAPLGTTLPTDLGELDPAFIDVGYLTEDGIELERKVDVQEFKALQGAKVVRKKVTSSSKDLKFTAMEENDTVAEARGDVESKTTVGELTVKKIRTSSRIMSYACVIDAIDGDTMKRKVIPRFDVAASGTETQSNANITTSELSGTIMSDYEEISGPVPEDVAPTPTP